MILGANPLLGLLNVSLAALIMLMTFLMMDDEALKYLRRKKKNLFKMEPSPSGNFFSNQSKTKTKPRKQKETKVSDVYVIDLDVIDLEL